MRWLRTSVAVLMVAGCGGSGSTGLIAPEQAALAEVRRDGTCVTLEETVTYCATDSPSAVSPGGATADGPLDGGGAAPTATPAAGRTATPGGAVPTPSPDATATSGGAPTSTAAGPTASAAPTAQPTPCPPGSVGCPGVAELEFVVRGLPPSAVCLIAGRPSGSDEQWSTGAPVAAGGEEVTITPPLPPDLGPGTIEVALLCYDTPPPEIPPRIVTLASAEPDVVFVPAEPVTIAPD